MNWFKKRWIEFRAWNADWPVYRVTYTTGERTRPLHYQEAKGCAEVFNGKLWLDYDYANYLINY